LDIKIDDILKNNIDTLNIPTESISNFIQEFNNFDTDSNIQLNTPSL